MECNSCAVHICISNDSLYLIAGYKDKNIRIWNYQSAEIIYYLGGHRETITWMTLLNSYKRIITGGQDKKNAFMGLSDEKRAKSLQYGIFDNLNPCNFKRQIYSIYQRNFSFPCLENLKSLINIL